MFILQPGEATRTERHSKKINYTRSKLSVTFYFQFGISPLVFPLTSFVHPSLQYPSSLLQMRDNAVGLLGTELCKVNSKREIIDKHQHMHFTFNNILV